MVIAAAIIVPLGLLFFISGLVVNLFQVWFLISPSFFLGLSDSFLVLLVLCSTL